VALDSRASLVAEAQTQLRAGDVLVTMGSGEVAANRRAILEQLERGRELPMSVGSIVPLEASLLERCVQHARDRASDVAVECGTARLTYRELVFNAQSLARALRESGVRPGDSVVVALEPSAERAVAFLAVLFAGAVYTPIAADLPSARIETMIDIAGACAAVVDASSETAFEARCVLLRCQPPEHNAGETITEVPSLEADDAAYMVFTSGTTGVPNAVVVARGAIDNLAASAARWLELRRTSRVAQLMTFGFDVAIGDMAQALYAGATLVFMKSPSARTGTPVARFLREREITHASFTPSLLSTVAAGAYQHLTHVLLCGEPCPQAVVERWAPGRRFFNAYGPTEATVYATTDECFAGKGVTIGRAIDNTVAWVHDGELVLAGCGLARGYHRNDALTLERFVDLELPDGSRRRCYRTGDLARMLADGRIELLGRRDAQVKLHGQRIELEEIESYLRAYPGIADAAAAIHDPGSSHARLLAFVVPSDPSTSIDGSELREYLACYLPPYAVPSRVVSVELMPLDTNGKRDRTALLELQTGPPDCAADMKAPSTIVERALHDMLEQALLLEGAFGIRETLESLGSDSFATATFYQAIEERFGCELPLQAYTDDQNIESLALYVERARLHVRPNEIVSPDWGSQLLSAQRGYLAAWTGAAVGPQGLLFLRNAAGPQDPLFWCFQGNEEHEALARDLGTQRPVYGMRSGYRLMDYTDANVTALADRYAEEMLALRPTGAFLVGGNCQGGRIARSIALHLRRRGRDVDLLVLMEQGRFPAYDESPVALIFGSESNLNPYRDGIANPDRVFAAAYPKGYSVDVIPGAHGTYFTQTNVGALARTVGDLLSRSFSSVNYV
jgi:amino acid adenylation domain-containing protein